MLRKLAIILGTVGLILITPYAMAHDHEGYSDDEARGTAMGYARVIDVEPLVREVRISVPVQECVRDSSYDPSEVDRGRDSGAYDPRRATAASTIVGGIVGAAIGNSIGSGDGRPLATVAGGVIGSAIGHEVAMSRAQDYGEGRARYRERADYDVQRCGVRYENRLEQHPDGYRVTYLFAGRRQETHLSYDPGEWLPVTAMPRWHHQDDAEEYDHSR